MSIRIGIGLDVFGAGIDANAQTIYNRIIADGGVSNLTRLNFFVKGLKAIYGDLANVPVCYDAHWIGYKLGSGTGATAGQAAAKLYSLTVAGDAVQATAASQPLLLSHNGDNYLFSSGVTGNNCTTSTNNNFEVSGNWTIDFNVSDLVVNGEYICKGNATNGWTIFLNAGVVRYAYFVAGVRTVDINSSAINLVDKKWCRMQRSGNNYAWFTSTDGITFTQVGSNVVDIVATASIAAPLRIGQGVSFFGSPCVMKTYRAKFYNDATQTTLITDFNPATYNASTSQTAWTSATGEVWTISTGTATTGYKGTIVDRVIVMSDGVDDNMISTVNRANLLTQYLAVKPYINDNTVDRTVIDANGTSFQNSISLTSSLFYYVLNGFGGSKAISNTINTLQILAAISNAGVKNSLSKNNSGEVSDTYTPTPSSNGIFVFGKGNGAANGKSNVILNTYIYINLADNLTIQTSTYNLLKTLNNL